MNPILIALIALSSAIDPKVKLEVVRPRAGSQSTWTTVGFNAYCFEKAGDTAKTERRTRAMADIFGQAAKYLAEHDVAGEYSVRTFSRAQDGGNTPRLHIVARETAGASASPAMDVNAQLVEASSQALELGFEFDTVPAAVSANSAVYLAFLRKFIASKASDAVVAEVGASTEGAAPVL